MEISSKQEPCKNLPEAHPAISGSDPGMNSEHPKEPLTERSETLSARRQTTDKPRTRPSNGAYVQHRVWGLTQWTTQVLNELLNTEWPNESLWKKKWIHLPLAYISKDIIFKEDFACTLKRQDLQNHCFVLLTDLQATGSICRWGKSPAAEACRLPPRFLVPHLGLPHLNKVQKWTLPQVKLYTGFQRETLGSSLLLSVAFLCPLHPDSGPPAPAGGCVIFCHKGKTLGNHGNSARIPKRSTLGT